MISELQTKQLPAAYPQAMLRKTATHQPVVTFGGDNAPPPKVRLWPYILTLLVGLGAGAYGLPKAGEITGVTHPAERLACELKGGDYSSMDKTFRLNDLEVSIRGGVCEINPWKDKQ